MPAMLHEVFALRSTGKDRVRLSHTTSIVEHFIGVYTGNNTPAFIPGISGFRVYKECGPSLHHGLPVKS